VVFLAERIHKLSYAIREFVPLARSLEEKGERVLYLNIGDPLKYDFDTPGHIKKALCEAATEGYNYYTFSEGDPELREAIALKEQKWHGVDVKAENIIVTHGVSEAIDFVCSVLLNRGEKALIPTPTYPLYQTYILMFDGKPVSYRCLEENGWQPDIEDIEKKIDEKTKFIVIINPNNPTGALYEEKTLKKILDIAAEHSLVVVSDEIYDGIVFEGEFKSLAKISKDVPVIVLNGFSKTFLMTGWRLGYLYVYDPTERVEETLMEAFIKVARCRLCVTTPIQRAGVAALKGSLQHLEEMKKKLLKRRDFIYKRVNEIEGLEAVKPKAAFYIFPKISERVGIKDDREFVKKLLLEEKVLVVHGSGFGDGCKGHFRAVFLPPEEVLEEAFERIERFLKRQMK